MPSTRRSCATSAPETAALVAIGSETASGNCVLESLEQLPIGLDAVDDRDLRGDVHVHGLRTEDERARDELPPARDADVEDRVGLDPRKRRAVAAAASTGPMPQASPSCPQSSSSVAATRSTSRVMCGAA